MLVGWGWAIVKDSFVSGNHFPGFFRVVLAAVALVCTLRPPRRIYATRPGRGGLRHHGHRRVPGGGPDRQRPRLRYPAGRPGPARPVRPDDGGHPRPGAQGRVPGPAGAGRPARPQRGHRALGGHGGLGRPRGPRGPPSPWSRPTARTRRTSTTLARPSWRPPGPRRWSLYWPLQFGFDSRDPYMDPPTTEMVIYCHYDQLAVRAHGRSSGACPTGAGGRWSSPGRGARFGEPVDVPGAPGRMVVASFSFGLPLLSKIDGLLLKPPDVYLRVWSGRAPPVTYRFVTGTQADEHVLSVPLHARVCRPFRSADCEPARDPGRGLGHRPRGHRHHVPGA